MGERGEKANGLELKLYSQVAGNEVTMVSQAPSSGGVRHSWSERQEWGVTLTSLNNFIETSPVRFGIYGSYI